MDSGVIQRERIHVGPRHVLVAAFLVVLVAFVQAWSLFGALVPLGPCGLGVLRYDDRTWTVVHAENVTELSAPVHWQGRGAVTSVVGDRLGHRDFGGTTLTFVPGSANPTGCA